jgi:hypothetical protein
MHLETSTSTTNQREQSLDSNHSVAPVEAEPTTRRALHSTCCVGSRLVRSRKPLHRTMNGRMASLASEFSLTLLDVVNSLGENPRRVARTDQRNQPPPDAKHWRSNQACQTEPHCKVASCFAPSPNGYPDKRDKKEQAGCLARRRPATVISARCKEGFHQRHTHGLVISLMKACFFQWCRPVVSCVGDWSPNPAMMTV